MDAQDRLARLERALGDPRDPGNPLGHRAVLDAERRLELPPGGEELLAAFGMHEEFVPAPLGGRLRGYDVPALLLRAVARRDFALALSYGGACLVPAAAVWCHGSAAQQAATARLLLAGDRLSVAFHDVAHGNDFSSSGVWARPGADGGLVLGGRKRVITNAPRAAALVVLARTESAGPAGRPAYSAVLVERVALSAGTLRDLPAVGGAGPRRCPSGGVEFLECRVPAGALLGLAGQGTEIMLRALQVTRALAPSMAVGCADTALRMALTGPQVRTKTARRAVGSAFLDLLICDSLLLTALRTLHLAPAESSLGTAAAKYLVPKLLREAVAGLAPAAAAGPGRQALATLRKQARDVAGLPPGHTGTAASLAAILPQLPTLARRSWTDGPRPIPGLFRRFGPLPDLDPARLSAAAHGDPLTNTLIYAVEAVEDALPGPGHEGLVTSIRALAKEFTVVRDECRALPERDPSALATPRGFAIAERYTLLAAAASCIGVWLECRGDPEAGFLAEPAWLGEALARVCRRLSLPGACGGRPEDFEAAFTQAVARAGAGRSLDLYETGIGPAADR